MVPLVPLCRQWPRCPLLLVPLLQLETHNISYNQDIPKSSNQQKKCNTVFQQGACLIFNLLPVECSHRTWGEPEMTDNSIRLVRKFPRRRDLFLRKTRFGWERGKNEMKACVWEKECVFLSACVREKDGGGKKMAQDSQKWDLVSCTKINHLIFLSGVLNQRPLANSGCCNCGFMCRATKTSWHSVWSYLYICKGTRYHNLKGPC